MKKQIALALAMLLAAAVFPFSLLSVKAEPELRWTVPAGYNAHDYNACAAFLEVTDANGVKNGAKLSPNYDPDDPATWGSLVDGWGNEFPHFEWDESGRLTAVTIQNHNFEQDACLVGTLDVSGCTELIELSCWGHSTLSGLSVAGCTKLNWLSCYACSISELDVTSNHMLADLYCYNNPISHLDVTNNPELQTLNCESCGLDELVLNNSGLINLRCSDNDISTLDLGCVTALQSLYCSGNRLASIDLSPVPSLVWLDCSDNLLTSLELPELPDIRELYCGYNMLTELDLSGVSSAYAVECRSNRLTALDISHMEHLQYLACEGNAFTELDLTAVTATPLELLRASGNGTVGFDNYYYPYYFGNGAVFAVPAEGETFEGWYTADGERVFSGEEFDMADSGFTALEARFSGSSSAHGSGDVDGSGAVNANDALLVLRAALGLIQLTQSQASAADVNNDGAVNANDALLILRAALGLTSL